MNASSVNYLLPPFEQFYPQAIVTVETKDAIENIVGMAAAALVGSSSPTSSPSSSSLISPVGGRHSGAGYAFAGTQAAITMGESMSIVGPIDHETLTLTIGAGATLGRVIDYLSNNNNNNNGTNGTNTNTATTNKSSSTSSLQQQYVTATGVCRGVGIAGWTLGGGYSVFSKWLGLGADNVVSMDIVLSDGTSVKASDASDNQYSDFVLGDAGRRTSKFWDTDVVDGPVVTAGVVRDRHLYVTVPTGPNILCRNLV